MGTILRCFSGIRNSTRLGSPEEKVGGHMGIQCLCYPRDGCLGWP